MSDEGRTGRELTPRPDDGSLTRGDRDLVPTTRIEEGVERFYAGDQAHTVGLTEERAAGIVRQSGNARNVAFLMSLIVILFIPLYWFLDIGIPVLGFGGRQPEEQQAQYITDVSRGYELYLSNCARCHGPDGKGGIGPPLNDQAKLSNVLTADGLPGTGHLNPNYIARVLEVGGRYVCGDPNSAMPAWLQPAGPLNYREVEELIAFLTASTEDRFVYQEEVAEGGTKTAPPPEEKTGWRDPNYQPDPAAPTPPTCWRNPSGQIGGGGGGAGGSAAPIENPGTAESPRVIALKETAALEITDESGTKVTAIPVKAGETVTFQVTNEANFVHNFYVGTAADLEANNTANVQGIPDFESGTQEFTWTVEADGELQFACTVVGHYQPMHGDFQIQP